jgi:sulfur-carrier protein
MATVKIPTPLRRYTDTQKSVIIAGKNVNEIIDKLLQQYPDICDLICLDGQLEKYVNIFIGSDYIGDLDDGMNTVVDDNTIVRIILPIAGG